MVEHFWDKYFSGEWPTDSSHVLGVENKELELNICSFLLGLDRVSMSKAQGEIKRLFERIEAVQASDTSSLFYMRFTELVAKYLYDPNSLFRSEDYYLPFVEAMVASRFTDASLLPAYEFELEKCRMNPYGSKVPDFSFVELSGRRGTLYSIKADYILVFFSNPGCHTCLEIMESLNVQSRTGEMIEKGELAILNIYIDAEVEKWKAYANSYPSNWINAYDDKQAINEGELYYVRAIPSLYLLDKDKRVIYKDAPTEKIIRFFKEIE